MAHPRAKSSNWALVTWQIKCRDVESLPAPDVIEKLHASNIDAVRDERWMTEMFAFLNSDLGLACSTIREEKDYGFSFLFQIPASRFEKSTLESDLLEFQTGRFYCSGLELKILERPINGPLHFGL